MKEFLHSSRDSIPGFWYVLAVCVGYDVAKGIGRYVGSKIDSYVEKRKAEAAASAASTKTEPTEG
jgi:hypothetical protein